MKSGITIENLWFDDDVIEVRFCPSNGRFSGVADVYTTQSALQEFARTLRRFSGRPIGPPRF